MTLFEIYGLIGYITNKDYGGNVISPADFNRLIKTANMDLFKVKMGLPEDYSPGAPYTRQNPDVTKRLTEETKFLKERQATQAVAAGVISYPADYFIVISLSYGYQRNVDGVATVFPRLIEGLTEEEYSSRAGNYLKRPTTWNPIYVIRQDGLYVYPTSIASVDFVYCRYPDTPEFDYDDSVPGVITDGGSSDEFEWPEILHLDLTRIILSYVGINLREEAVLQYAEQKKAQGV